MLYEALLMNRNRTIWIVAAMLIATAGVCSADGRITSIMPHPERVFRSVQHSWAPREWGEDGAWMRLFRNARVFTS